MTNMQNGGAGGSVFKSVLGVAGFILMALFGVFLPALSLAVELLSRWCAEICFDPIPTVYHALLVALVAVGNLAMLLVLRGIGVRHLKVVSAGHAFTLGVAACYTLLFLPFTPFAVIGIMFFGIGFLPLAPLCAFVCGLVMRIRLHRAVRRGDLAPVPAAWWGVALAVLVLAAFEVPKAVTYLGIQMAADEEPARQARGIRLLRTAGSPEMILRACYQRQAGIFGDPVGQLFNLAGERVSSQAVRDIYYRVTGTPFNAVKPPSFRAMRGEWAMEDWDFNVGGDEVQGRLRGLSLGDSRLDMVADPLAATAYMEWTLVFKNNSARQQEARGQVVLPVGGVVSRLTLWIDGEEREAAFGPRGQVKEAYRKVVQRRRDPVLVTTTGPDQIMVQCFPVPPNGAMKVRIGITAPLDLDTPDFGHVRLPHFCEHNFNLPANGTHAVWAESDKPLKAGAATTNLAEEMKADGAFALRGNLPITALNQPCAIGVTRPPKALACRTADTRAPGQEIRQQIVDMSNGAPSRIVVVVDGSRRMLGNRETVAKALMEAARPDVQMAVFLAGDEIQELMKLQPVSKTACSAAAEAVRAADFVGGCDNVRALDRAWDIAAGGADGVILWLHATQPVVFSGLEGLRQKWERRPDGPRLLDMQFGPGPNVLIRPLDGIAAVRSIARTDAPERDLVRQFQLWNTTAGAYRYERVAQATGATEDVVIKSAHIARLWALDSIRAAVASRRQEDIARAQTLAVTYQLVTPVSGAIVLETQQQYQEAGLAPVAANTVPTIPEPETWMLLVVGSGVMFAVLFIRRRRRVAC